MAGKLPGNFGTGGLVVPDGQHGIVFIISGNTLISFNMKNLAVIATVTLSNLNGMPTQLIRWGLDFCGRAGLQRRRGRHCGSHCATACCNREATAAAQP